MTALLILLLGAVSLALQATAGRPEGSRRTVLLLTGGGLVVVAVLAGLFLLGAGLVGTAVALAGAAAWAFANLRPADERTVVVRWGAMILVVVLCAVIDAFSGGHGLGPAGSIDRVTAGAGALMLLTTPANEPVAAVLALARGADVAGRVRGDGSRKEATESEADGASTAPESPSVAHQVERETSSATADASGGAEADGQDDGVPSLHGGRWIGPLERVLLILLAGAGANAALAAIIAAKGVIRFPEISKDASGLKAEEFLIGSLTSWTLAVLGVLLVVA
ncbi:hypothetical protein [Actinomyces radicidentis]|uniref:hypothetical protein n=1 Tax=Actinomyces radicidentis TaxID=111015 RepID=UPI0026DF3011|nr:hypothetical protein [Actinomyces radicidentis]